MDTWGNNNRLVWRLGAALLLSSLGLAGCGKQPAPEQGSTKPEAVAAASAPQNSGTTAPAGSNPGAGAASTTASPPLVRDALQQSFAEATRSAENPPADEPRPPDATMTNKRTHKILEEVQKQWDSIRFVNAAGQPISYWAAVEVEDLGVFEIDLKHLVAPNHVRNFIALARAGYYDGLRFDRIRHEEAKTEDGLSVLKLDLVKGGCPLGTGEVESGHIGYWLKPEFTDKEKHDEGTVGACHGIEPDTAGTRFYITLNKAPYLDDGYTVFGQVRSGLDVVRRMSQRPVAVEDQDRDSDHRPKTPILIKKITIHTGPRAGVEG